MITNSPAPEPRQPRRSRNDVVAAALGILDRQGLPDLTMRNLAASLGLQPSALYWHFPNKQSLLAAVADDIVSRARPVAGSGDWLVVATATAVALHDALLAFKDGAEVVSSTHALGLGTGEASARLAGAIGMGGFDPVIADRATEALLNFVIGQTWHEQQRLHADSLGVVASTVATDPHNVGAAQEGPAVFELGIALFLGGLEAREQALRR